MTAIVHAVFDGRVFRPDEPVELKPNTRVRITIETDEEGTNTPETFLKAARGLQLEGPEDWSQNVDDYLYHSTDTVDDDPEVS